MVWCGDLLMLGESKLVVRERKGMPRAVTKRRGIFVWGPRKCT